MKTSETRVPYPIPCIQLYQHLQRKYRRINLQSLSKDNYRDGVCAVRVMVLGLSVCLSVTS